jgi:hypothetical protein
VTDATPHSLYVDRDQWPPEPGWGRGFLQQCEIDPDDPAEVRAAYESCQRAYALWLRTGEGDVDGEAYYMLVESIQDLYGWDAYPLDWPAPYLFLQDKPFRNLLQRKPRETT